jgi:acyl carrier protein
MITMDELLAVVRDELGLPVTANDINRSFDEIPGWDSVHFLWLLTFVERRTGRNMSLPDLLAARTLERVHAAVTST